MRQIRDNKGFTLIELMIVVVIIGILAAIAIPKFSGVSKNAKESEAPSVLKQIHTLQESFRELNGSYASTLPATGATTFAATDLTGWEAPNAKYYNFSLKGATATSYTACAVPTVSTLKLQTYTISVADASSTTPAANDGKPIPTGVTATC